MRRLLPAIAITAALAAMAALIVQNITQWAIYADWKAYCISYTVVTDRSQIPPWATEDGLRIAGS